MDGLTSIQSLFGEKAFRIPPYQRGYSWDILQWNDLLEDLEVLPPGKDHFGGPVVLHPTLDVVVDVEGTAHSIYNVVDGQQRLTSLVLLLEAIRRRTNGALAEGISKRYVWITDRADQPQAKLTFTDGSQTYFERSVLADSPAPGGAETKAQQRLSQALEHFERYLDQKQATASSETWLSDFHDRIAQHLKVSVLEVQDEKEVGLIFEVLNSRGRPLSELDLVKNYILYVGTKLEPEHDLHAIVADEWSRILRHLMDAGAGSPGDENQLLRAHWLMRYDHQKKRWERNRSIKRRFRLRDYEGRHREFLAHLTDYVNSLADAAVAYADIQDPTRQGAFSELAASADEKLRIVRASERLHRTRAVAAFLPLLIAARMRCGGQPTLYLELVETAERYAFRVYRLLGRRSDAGQSTISRIGYDVYHGNITLDDAIAQFKGTLLSYCSDQKLREAFELEEVGTWYGWSGLKYFLYEYEQHLTGADAVRIPWETIERLDKEKTIEHILPQTPTDPYWQSHFTPEEIERFTHDIGNLVLTADNRSYSNKAFPEKKGTLTAIGPCYLSPNALASERELGHYEEWTPETILDRHARLLEWVVQRWAISNPPVESIGSVDFEEDERVDVTAED